MTPEPELTRRRFLLGGAAVVGAGGLWLRFGTTPTTEAQVNPNITRRNMIVLALRDAGPTSGQGPATPVSPDIRTPTPTVTPRPEITPTRTPAPTTEGKPTLSPEAHFARLKTVDSITVNGITTRIRRTDAALVWAGFSTPQLKDNYAGIISRNIANINDNTIKEVAIVFVKNRADSPILINDPNAITMGGFSVPNKNGSRTYAGIAGDKKFDGRLVFYFGFEKDFDTSDAVAVYNRDWYIAARPVSLLKNGIPRTKEENDILEQRPIRVIN